jgi:hypothetical protein
LRASVTVKGQIGDLEVGFVPPLEGGGARVLTLAISTSISENLPEDRREYEWKCIMFL